MIQSVQKALQLLQILSDGKQIPISLMEISERAGVPKPTCCHLLQTLCEEGFAVRVSHTKGYVLGPRTYYLTRYGQYEEELVSLCRQVMRWMERESHGTVVLSVIRSGQKYIINYEDTEQQLFFEHPQLRMDDIFRTATGRAILAHMKAEAVREIYERHGPLPKGHWDEIRSLQQLQTELQKLRRQKIVVTQPIDSEAEFNAVGYACPLFRAGVCIGAIGIARKPSGENTEDETLRRILLKGTKEIQRRLDYEKE